MRQRKIVARELTNLEKTQRLKFALAGDACNSIYLNLATAGSVLLLFMDRLGLDKAQMGALLAVLGLGPMISPLTTQLGAIFGFKRLSLSFSVLRVIMLAGMIAAPWVAAKYGPAVAFKYVAAVLIAFSLCRSAGDSMGGPWSIEFIPASIRGRFMARQMIVTMLCGAGSIFVIGHFLGQEAAISRFQMFFAIALVFGLMPSLCYSQVEGGAPHPGARLGIGNILVPLRDPVYRRHLLGNVVINLGWCAAMPFAPLYLRDQIGLPPDQVVSLDAITMLGSLTSSFIWGWAADRYGGKPVMVSLLSLHVLLPTGLILMPHHSVWSHQLAMAMYFTHGFISIGWIIGFYRYFFINLIPKENRVPYIALNSCIVSAVVGSGPLWAGFVLQRMSGFSGHIGPLAINAHTPFFFGAIICAIISTWLMAGLPSAGAVGTRQFAGLFLQGNPLATAASLVGFRYAGREDKRVAIVERLGASRSPLTVNELIEALEDPSFSVRYEAIVSSVRTVRDPRLLDALTQLLHNADPGLQMAAVWALGRMGDERACPALRVLLDAPYRTLRAQAARSLGMLADHESAEKLIRLFRSETDVALRIAYGSAVASLNRAESLGDLLQLLRELASDQDSHRRREVSMAIATLVGQDEAALRLWRRMHDEPGNTLAAVLLAMRQRLSQGSAGSFPPATMRELIERCAYAFAGDDFEAGTADLITVIDAVKPDAFTAEAQSVLADSRQHLCQHGGARREYIMLATHALHVGLRATA